MKLVVSWSIQHRARTSESDLQMGKRLSGLIRAEDGKGCIDCGNKKMNERSSYCHSASKRYLNLKYWRMILMMNRVVLVGRLTRDPELKYTPSGVEVAVATYTLAVNRNFTNG
jgi:hypothetical protein